MFMKALVMMTLHALCNLQVIYSLPVSTQATEGADSARPIPSGARLTSFEKNENDAHLMLNLLKSEASDH